MNKSLRHLIDLCHHNKNIHILATLSLHKGCKFIYLAKTLNINRDTLTRTLHRLQQKKLILKNPGYGHPLRPEYIVTEVGQPLAEACSELNIYLKRHSLDQFMYHKWNLPLIALLQKDTFRFNQLKSKLYPISPRQLINNLKQLEDHGLIVRTIKDSYPPTAVYSLDSTVYGLLPVIEKVSARATTYGTVERGKQPL